MAIKRVAFCNAEKDLKILATKPLKIRVFKQGCFLLTLIENLYIFRCKFKDSANLSKRERAKVISNRI